MKIGLVPISAKPYHLGHHSLVELAASQNKKVFLFVSLSDRNRPGEYPISGKSMEKVWKNFIEPILPPNVEVNYGGSPVRKVYETIGEACEINSRDIFTIYSDPEDTAVNYPSVNRDKYLQPLCRLGQVKFAAEENPDSVTRGIGTPNISGTKMREFLEAGDLASFAAGLPSSLDAAGVFDILTTPEVIREYVQAVFFSG